MGRRLALLIATYRYQDAGLRRLTAPAHDAEALAVVLEDPAIAGFEVTTLINEPHHRVGQAIGDFYRDRRRDDLTLLYFTGHGPKDDAGRLYLAMTDTLRDNLLFTGLSAEHIDQAMDGCMSRQKVLVLDCCYSGAFPGGRLAKGDPSVHALERFQGRGRIVLTASDATQYSFEGDQPHGQAAQSVFTRHLLAGLRDGSADLDGDGDITLDELYSYVHDRVVDQVPQQRPKKQDNVEGRIVVARNINWALPAYLRNALGSPIATDRLAAMDGLAHLHRIGNDNVRSTVHEEVARLVEDDSRGVSAAATALLESLRSGVDPPTEAPTGPPETPTTPAIRHPAPPAEPARPAGRRISRLRAVPSTTRMRAELLYVVISTPVGILAAAYTVVTLFYGGLTLIVVAGLPILAASTLGARVLSTLHLRIARRFLGETTAAPRPIRPASGVRQWVKARLRDLDGWRAHGHLLLEGVLGVLTFATVIVFYVVGPAAISYPVWGIWMPDRLYGRWVPGVIEIALGGALLLLLAPRAVHGMLALRRRLVTALLAHRTPAVADP
jgi:Putative sensor/Caspase domain